MVGLMKIYDISMSITNDMTVYKNLESKKPKLEFLKIFENDGFNESRISMDIHTGTHIDAPLHMVDKGDTSENLDLSKLVRECHVIDLTDLSEKISKEDLERKNIKEKSFVLFKTKNSYDRSFNPNFVYLDESGAKYLANLNIHGVGIDSLGIERGNKNHTSHKILFDKNIIIIEGLRLEGIDEGEYFMHALPLKIVGADGAPARVVISK